MSGVAGTGGRFTLICVGAALILGLINALIAPVIRARGERDFQGILRSLVGDDIVGPSKRAENVPGVRLFYPVRDKAGKTVSVIVDLQGEGYGGEFTLVAVYKRNGEILSAKLLQNMETTGMGKKAESAEYMKKFARTGAEKPVPLRKAQLKPEDAQAVSGATMTFFGIARALERGSKFVQTLGDLK
jgi:Na+-translocating ferredoxin:NAD+ oxidoreductase RnfG subunit